MLRTAQPAAMIRSTPRQRSAATRHACRTHAGRQPHGPATGPVQPDTGLAPPCSREPDRRWTATGASGAAPPGVA